MFDEFRERPRRHPESSGAIFDKNQTATRLDKLIASNFSTIVMAIGQLACDGIETVARAPAHHAGTSRPTLVSMGWLAPILLAAISA